MTKISEDIPESINEQENRYQLLFNEMTAGFAVHDIICNEKGIPIDYRFIEVNPAFEKFTGLSAKKITGKTLLEVLPQSESSWIERYGKVALTGEPIEFEAFSKELDKYYNVKAFCPQKGSFAVIFNDITEIVKNREEMNQRIDELELFYKATIDREKRIVELKDKVKELEERLNSIT